MAKKTFKIRDNLAQALGDTVSTAKNNAGELHIEVIPLRKIELDPENPRDLLISLHEAFNGIASDDANYDKKNAEKESLKSIIESIKEQGLINPILVYKHGDKYRLIAGERRTLGSILAGKEDIQAKILTTKPSPLKISLLQWIENMERSDLTLWERLRNLEKVLLACSDEAEKKVTVNSPTELGQLLGFSLQQAANYYSLLKAPQKLKQHIQNDDIKNIEKAALIARAPGSLQDRLIEACISGATLKELKNLIADNKVIETVLSKKLQKGRQSSRVNLGTTKNIGVAKTIIEALLQNEKFSHLSQKVSDILWDDYKSVTNAFKLLISALERTNSSKETQ